MANEEERPRPDDVNRIIDLNRTLSDAVGQLQGLAQELRSFYDRIWTFREILCATGPERLDELRAQLGKIVDGAF